MRPGKVLGPGVAGEEVAPRDRHLVADGGIPDIRHGGCSPAHGRAISQLLGEPPSTGGSRRMRWPRRSQPRERHGAQPIDDAVELDRDVIPHG